MIELANIRPYVEKLTYIMAIVLEMDVLFCDESLRILGDNEHNGNVCEEEELLQEGSVISKAIRNNKKIIYLNAKNESAGCKVCKQRSSCKTETIIAYPIERNGIVYGGIGIYSQEDRQKEKLISQEKIIIEYITCMGDLILTKLEEEENRERDILKKANELISPMKTGSLNDIIGESDAIKLIKEDAMAFADSKSNVLILGESGTGKEIIAKAMHNVSIRREHPFVAVNCAAIPDNLLESELFGYVEGAFTGASKGGREGKFELADKGTLFLDEIGEMPIYLQPKLLRVIQDRKIQRVGSNKDRQIDIRIIAATNRNLGEMMKTGEFREDLFYRLSVIPIKIPPLRERKEDIPLFLKYFLEMYKDMLKKNKIQGFDNAALELLHAYEWPGNVRELQNTVEYAVNKGKNEVLGINELPSRITSCKKDVLKYPQDMRHLEIQAIKNAISYFGNDKNGKVKAAEALGISRATLYRKIKEYDL